ncbi:hypothetical protein K439DRAFT_1129960 [Ramaria rubella]|nr:hypothetical protein K439DRAFT_1129960 [Ramaria rubella]
MLMVLLMKSLAAFHASLNINTLMGVWLASKLRRKPKHSGHNNTVSCWRKKKPYRFRRRNGRGKRRKRVNEINAIGTRESGRQMARTGRVTKRNRREKEDEDERREKERLKDLRERDAFAERIRQKDRDKTKKVVEDHSSKRSAGAAAEAAQRRQLADDTAARVAAMPSLREHSRQEYLSKREIQQIELLRKEIEDDENLFHGMKVSKRERRDLEYKKEVLRLAEERLKIDDKYDGYQLPEDYLTEQGKIDKKRKEGVLYQRYEEARDQAKEGQFSLLSPKLAQARPPSCLNIFMKQVIPRMARK